MKKNDITLYIDTTGIREARVAIEVDGKRYEKESSSAALRSQAVLPLINELTGEAHIRMTDITGIRVAEGPGSFTGLRVGLAVANMLGVLLEVPVNGKKALVTPRYS